MAAAQAGHLVGHVTSDEGVTKRVSNCTPVPLGYHADNSDIVFLACRTQAQSGGEQPVPPPASQPPHRPRAGRGIALPAANSTPDVPYLDPPQLQCREETGGRVPALTAPLSLLQCEGWRSCEVAGVARAGVSSCCSSHALHNEILERRPDLHKVPHPRRQIPS